MVKCYIETPCNVYWALIEKQTCIVTIDTASVSLSLLHMTDVNFLLSIEAVAMSRGSGGSLIVETIQDHSIHTPPQTYTMPSGASTASYVY
jgi:hypothetical protein